MSREIHGYGLAQSPTGGEIYVAAREAGAVTILRPGPAGVPAFAGCVAYRRLGGARCSVVDQLFEPEAVAVSPGTSTVIVADRGGAVVALRQTAGARSLRASGCLSSAGVAGCRRARWLASPAGVAVAADGGAAFVAAAGSHALQAISLEAGA